MSAGMTEQQTPIDTSDADAPMGTFACPICGVGVPHHHSDDEVAAYRLDAALNDGWTSTAHRQPAKRGWYLCLGVEINRNQFGEKKDIWTRNDLWSQLSWFLWVREGGTSHCDAQIPEVLYWDPDDGGWRLRNLLGDASVSGAESRRTVHVQPKLWR